MSIFRTRIHTGVQKKKKVGNKAVDAAMTLIKAASLPQNRPPLRTI